MPTIISKIVTIIRTFILTIMALTTLDRRRITQNLPLIKEPLPISRYLQMMKLQTRQKIVTMMHRKKTMIEHRKTTMYRKKRKIKILVPMNKIIMGK